jgi:SAM-dependent methyltransferase
MNLGWRYDLFEWVGDTFLLRGALRRLRRRTADLAGLQPGEAVLDVGCGTGTLALDAVRHVGPKGRVVGVDPGQQQIARARAKASRSKLPGAVIDFQIGVIERLPFPGQTFDVVLSTLMMHHLPDDLKRQGLAEVVRVLKPEGRLIIADFMRAEGRSGHEEERGRIGSGASRMPDLVALVRDAGFANVETGEMRMPRFPAHLRDVSFIRATREEVRVTTRFQPFIAAIKQQMQPEGRAQHLVGGLQLLLALVPEEVTLADLVAGWQVLARPQNQQEPSSVAHRRGVCAELAAIGAGMYGEPGHLAGAVRAWKVWLGACQTSADRHLAIMAKTFARELEEMQSKA